MSDLAMRVSACGRYHEDASGLPLYPDRFDEVLPFHADGTGGFLAPVRHQDDAWHIRPNGTSAYSRRYRRCFGFYESRAAATDSSGWLHIRPDGTPISEARFVFAGNFQSGRAVVCDMKRRYFHILPDGQAAYSNRWSYCGDYREGVAVVQNDDGLHSHIDFAGMLLHGIWFEDLDVFHKGYARAHDVHGWHHVDRLGHAIYSTRFEMIEPFYNGCARVKRYDGSIAVIDERGVFLRELRDQTRFDL